MTTAPSPPAPTPPGAAPPPSGAALSRPVPARPGAPPPASIRTLGLAALGSVLAGAVVFVGAVLPAEYGVDPTGVGARLGLLALAQVAAVTDEPEAYRQDAAELPLAPGAWVEYTYRVREGAGLLYSWTATGPVEYNLHSAPDGAPPGYAESFDAGARDAAHGSYIAPFTGVHGWYWENPGDREVTITLHTAGFYRDAHVVRDRADGYRTLRDVRGIPLE